MPEYARIITKTSEGVPTVPLSASHDDGSWIATDIYEDELYLDSLTGFLWTRIGNDVVQLSNVTLLHTHVKADITDYANIAEGPLPAFTSSRVVDLANFNLGFSLAADKTVQFTALGSSAQIHPGGTGGGVFSAVMNIESLNKGFLIPRLTTAAKNSIVAPENGLMVFDITLNRFEHFSTTWKPFCESRTYPLNASSTNPASNGVYFLGSMVQALNTSATFAQIRPFASGVITKVNLLFQANSVVGSAEAITASVLINGVATPIGSVANTQALREFNAILNQPIPANSQVSIQLNCPAWATSPTNVTCAGTITVIS
jgi:hypothetical protein